ncbi:hypothetical protein D915_004490 [Fasciola hepatica]|uniref:Uncharacterized protein n=1 Tax=Fasciola hepatica TaxID=6192 RepID=A0A4E0RZI2_FASHE|nr:hypothetical protein D915_004490 [Fasciola hepatica]
MRGYPEEDKAEQERHVSDRFVEGVANKSVKGIFLRGKFTELSEAVAAAEEEERMEKALSKSTSDQECFAIQRQRAHASRGSWYPRSWRGRRANLRPTFNYRGFGTRGQYRWVVHRPAVQNTVTIVEDIQAPDSRQSPSHPGGFIIPVVSLLANCSDTISTMTRVSDAELCALVDTGATRSLINVVAIPHLGAVNLEPCEFSMTDVNGRNFAKTLAASRIARLLNLNIGHQPYLKNPNSKNVYFLVKASLSIVLNIFKVPGNSELFIYPNGYEALQNLLTLRQEETLRCLATLCLVYASHKTSVARNTRTTNMLQAFVDPIYWADVSTRRRCHGFSVAEYLSVLSTLCANDAIKTWMVAAQIAN